MLLIIYGWLIFVLAVLGLIAGIVDEDYTTAFWGVVLGLYAGLTLDVLHRIRKAKKATEFEAAIVAAIDKRKR